MKIFKLENEPKIKSGFTIPEHYFNDFSEKLLFQLPEEKNNAIPLFQKRKKLILAAAAILIIGLLIPIYNQFTPNSQELDSNTLENHLTYQTDINPYDLISELEDKDITKMESKIPLKNEVIEDILTENPDLERLITE